MRSLLEDAVELMFFGWPVVLGLACILGIGMLIYRADAEATAKARACAEECYPRLSALSHNLVCMCAAPRGGG